MDNLIVYRCQRLPSHPFSLYFQFISLFEKRLGFHFQDIEICKRSPMKITTLVQIRKINGNNNKLDKQTNKQAT